MIASESRTPKMLLLELKLFELRTVDSLSHLLQMFLILMIVVMFVITMQRIFC